MVSGDITFTVGSSNGCVNVGIRNDVIVQDTETVTLGLKSTDCQAMVTDTTTLSIVDDDGMSVRATGSLDGSFTVFKRTVPNCAVLYHALVLK